VSQTQYIPAEWQWLLDLDPDEISAAVPESVRELIDVIGPQAAVRLHMHYGGMQLYIQQLDGAFRRLRDARIREEFSGANHVALGRRYGLSTNRIREIVADEPTYEQPSLFAQG
jgi:Mor family transcriptional regulator